MNSSGGKDVRAKIGENRLLNSIGIKKKAKSGQITFAEQAEKFLISSTNRKRSPLRPSSVRAYTVQINTHLVPLIGHIPLQNVVGNVLRDVVTKLSEKGLSPRAIGLNVFLVKKIRRSAVSDDGGVLFPYEWNSEVIDAPSIDATKRPTVSGQQVTDAISKALADNRPENAALYAILAGTGLRIAEALAIKLGSDDGVSTVWLPSESKIIVRQQMTRTGVGPTKTKAGMREVDMSPELEILSSTAPVADFVFSETENIYRKQLLDDGISGGFHVFRRFRTTHLRMNGVPDALVDYWTGHAAGTITEQYTQVAGEIESRKSHATRAGLGFQLPEDEQ